MRSSAVPLRLTIGGTWRWMPSLRPRLSPGLISNCSALCRAPDCSAYSAALSAPVAASYQGLKLYEKAIDAYQYAIVIDEKFDYAYRNMGDAFLRLNDDELHAFEKAIAYTIGFPISEEDVGQYLELYDMGYIFINADNKVTIPLDVIEVYNQINNNTAQYMEAMEARNAKEITAKSRRPVCHHGSRQK